jgi:hypothetical protein
MSNPHHSAATPEHYTPTWLVDAARTVLDGIDLDPASCSMAQSVVDAARYYSLSERGENGLLLPWDAISTVFVNAPGSPMGKLAKAFWTRAWDTHISRGVTVLTTHFSLEQILSLGKLDSPSPLEMPCWFPSKRVSYDTIGRSDLGTEPLRTIASRAGTDRSKVGVDSRYMDMYQDGIRLGTLIRVPGTSPTHGSFISLMTTSDEIRTRFYSVMASACEAEQGKPGHGVYPRLA